MKPLRSTLGFGFLGALIAATYEGIAWTDTCSGASLQILCFTRGDVMTIGAVTGFVLGAAFGLIVWAVWTLVRCCWLRGRSAPTISTMNRRYD